MNQFMMAIQVQQDKIIRFRKQRLSYSKYRIAYAYNSSSNKRRIIHSSSEHGIINITTRYSLGIKYCYSSSHYNLAKSLDEVYSQ